MKVFIDFDGVICNSLRECYVSSKIASDPSFTIETPILKQDFNGFQRLRPMIRSGEDYVLIHETAKEKLLAVHNQNDFDHLRDQAGAKLKVYKEKLYQVRDKLLSFQREAWLSLNLLYEGWSFLLPQIAKLSEIFILSTKKSSYILEILKYNKIDFPKDRVLYSTATEKGEKINEYSKTSERCFLIDDQVAHFSSLNKNFHLGILAKWGFGAPNLTYEPKWDLKETLENLSLQNLQSQDPKENSFLRL